MTHPSFQTFGIDFIRLDRAISNVLGHDVYEELKKVTNRPKIHDMAIRKAFVCGASADDIFVLKSAATVLDHWGYYKITDYDLKK